MDLHSSNLQYKGGKPHFNTYLQPKNLLPFFY